MKAKYTKKQILESIKYWKKQLNESFDYESFYADIEELVKKYPHNDHDEDDVVIENFTDLIEKICTSYAYTERANSLITLIDWLTPYLGYQPTEQKVILILAKIIEYIDHK